MYLRCFVKGIFIDQVAFNKANIDAKHLSAQIDGTWNRQFLSGGLPFLPEAKIIHYYTSRSRWNPYLLCNEAVYETVKNNGVTPEMETALQSSQRLFSPKTVLVSDEKTVTLMSSYIFSFMLKHEKAAAFSNGVIALLKNLKKIKG